MKALFFDIDGTLVNFQGKMPDSARHALRRVQEKGHKIVLCSGRSRGQIYPWLLEMGFDGVIGASGAYVECGGGVIYEHHMKKETVIAAQTLLEQAGACYAAQAAGKVFVKKESGERLLNRLRAMGLEEDATAQIWKNTKIDEQLEQRRDIEKIVFFDSRMPVSAIQERLSEYCEIAGMSFERTDDYSGEISSRGINKSLGIRKYIEYAGIGREDTIAFGDGPNDFDMIEYVQTGIAMGNAIDALKEQADFVTKGIDEDGIACALEALGL